MPTQRQIIVELTPSPTADFGKRSQDNLNLMFPESPIIQGLMTDDERRKCYMGASLVGDVTDSFTAHGDTIAGGPGNGLASHDRDYPDAPDLSTVDILALNLPSPYMPNRTSPGPGNVANPSQKPADTGAIPDMATNVEFGSGIAGGPVSPSTSAPEIADQNLAIGSLISGKSYAGSDGIP